MTRIGVIGTISARGIKPDTLRWLKQMVSAGSIDIPAVLVQLALGMLGGGPGGRPTAAQLYDHLSVLSASARLQAAQGAPTTYLNHIKQQGDDDDGPPLVKI